ncbi:MAG: DNA polymerase Y family protein [Azonexus sp.]|nr:DNA polymerase Y family protein [Azonexus sp.]
MLWLALHFPLLPLEALPWRRSPSVVVARGRVLACDLAAAAAGVAGGQKLSTALGLQPGLAVGERDPALERKVLESLACWAGRFTPTVSLAPPAGLLLEIGGCLRLFGGAPAIVEAALAGCAQQAYSVAWAAAPTPLGACWLAQAGNREIHATLPAMQAALGGLPCTVPGWPAGIPERLGAFGLQRLGDLAGVPAAGLRRRLGNGPVDDLLRARGELPDPQRPFVFPQRFAGDLDLPARVEHAEALAFAGQRLLAALSGWLHARQLLARACTLHLRHDDGTHSALPLRLAEASADDGRFLRLLREHLGRLQLAAPVEALRLAADEVIARPGASAHLFEQPPVGEGAPACLERLRARLGEGAVRALARQADHRPECATREYEVAADSASAGTSTAAFAAPRPLWLLPEPQALAERPDGPHWHGPLQLLTRGERLESGWWDAGEAGAAGDLQRDYFVASNPQRQRVWVFRDARGWFLHGLFA